MWQSHTGFIKIFPQNVAQHKITSVEFRPPGCGCVCHRGDKHPVYFKCVKCGAERQQGPPGAASPPRADWGALLLSNDPKGWDATRSSWAKRHFKCVLQRGARIMFVHSLSWGISFEGKLTAEPLVATRFLHVCLNVCVCVCVFVCLNLFYSLFLPEHCGMAFLLQKFQEEVN